MTVPTRHVPVRQIEVRVPVPVSIISGAELHETQGACILSDHVAEVLAPLVDQPGFIGFKTERTAEITKLLLGPHAGLLFDNVTRHDIAEVGIVGLVRGPFTNWDRTVYVPEEAYGPLVPVIQIPFGAEVWVCTSVTEASCHALMSEFYTPDPDEL